MHVLICNERLLFRFGVDRALLIIGQGLARRGHRVSVMANRLDEQVAASFAHQLIKVGDASGRPYGELDSFTREWVEANWSSLFAAEDAPDVVLCGGWPFFSSIPAFTALGARTVFIDCGAVPLDGYSGEAHRIQQKVRELRAKHLPDAAALAPISDFIALSQSAKDAPRVPARTILLGADHMQLNLWADAKLERTVRGDGPSALQRLDALKSEGRRVVLNLGRWEPGSYKGSETLFALAAAVRPSREDVSFAVLARAEDLGPAAARHPEVVPLGFPDDAELTALMRAADVGVTTSRWEGFNLPLAEMQLEGGPVLALDLAAHPEVIAHPWYLCRSTGEMAEKLVGILSGGGPQAVDRTAVREAFARKFRWARVVHEIEDLLMQSHVSPRAPIVLDVTNATRDPANSGVIRVARRLGNELQRADFHPVFAVWDDAAREYVLPTRSEARQLSQFNGPQADDALCSDDGARIPLASAWERLPEKPGSLLLVETVLEERGREIRRYARAQGLKLAAVFYDAIPVLRPDLCWDTAIRDNHAAYMRGLAECDLVIPISEFSAECLRDFWRAEGLPDTHVRAEALPGEFGAAPRTAAAPARADGRADVLCVSTLEPRKNHRTLLEAFSKAARARPELDWHLTLVGNSYAGGGDIVRMVERAAREDPRIKWTGVVDDATLHSLYASATFTVYPSLIEGFGLPILESLWHGKPCLCHREGVMAELARDGGCETVDAADAGALAEAMIRLATDPARYAELAQGAVSREIKTWPQYAVQVANAAGVPLRRPPSAAPSAPAPAPARARRSGSWQDVLYPDCRLENWQMNESERMALTGVLGRVEPRCSIEVGTFHGGSLSVISQYSDMVFSIDIDPTVPDRIRGLDNVSFLIGPSKLVLPRLLTELNAEGIPVDFVLIDGDHSAEGVRQDIETLLDYVPRERMLVLLHDGFNPGCRRGMLEARWERSPYVHAVDVDFVPGRVIEHGGGGDGEMWGGLAMAYFDPEPRSGPLVVLQTSQKAFQRALESQAGGAPVVRCAS